MKRILCAVLALAMCATAAVAFSGCGCSSNNSNEPGYTVEPTKPDLEGGDYGYYIINKNELMITEYKGADKDVVIPDTYNDYKVTAIGAFVFDSSDITSVTIPDTITEIKDYAFASCKQLKSVKLPSSLKTLGTNVFFFCSALESIELPASIEDLGIYTFTASGLKSVKIPESNTLTLIDNFVFYQCPQLTDVYIPATVTEINENSFADCKNPVTIHAPAGSYAEEYATANSFAFAAE